MIRPTCITRTLLTICLATLLLTGCVADSAERQFSIKPAWDHPVDGLIHYSIGSGTDIWVQDSPIVTAEDIQRAWYVKDNLEQPAVMVDLDRAGAARMGRFTSGHLNQPLAVFVNDELVSAPFVSAEIGSQFLITGLGGKPHAEHFILRCTQFNAAKRK